MSFYSAFFVSIALNVLGILLGCVLFIWLGKK